MAEQFQGTLLKDAQDWLRPRLDEGAICPCCRKKAKITTRPINSGMAHALIQMYRHAGTEWFHLPDITYRWRGRDEACLAYWGLIEELQERREDGGKAGWWRVTELGEKFICREVRVQKYARTYNKKVLSLVGDEITIVDALANRFNYNELMGR